MIPLPPRTTLFPYTTLFRSEKEYDKAIEILNDMIEQHPKEPIGYINFGNLLLQMKEYDRAQNFFKRAIKYDKEAATADRKSTRLNSSHVAISYAVFCLKKKK